MRISLNLVREVLKDALGRDSFIASFITKVKEDAAHPTAGITKDGVLHYNPIFTGQYIHSKEDLFALLFHEALHPAFSHFIHRNDDLENLACDAIINAVISTVYFCESNDGRLFERLYPEKGITALLRPESKLHDSRYRKVYATLYSRSSRSEKTTAGELIQTLKILSRGKKATVKVVLLGSHGALAKDSFAIPEEIAAKIACEISVHVRQKDAGYSELLKGMLLEVLKSKASIKKVLLEKYSTRKKLDNFKRLFEEKTRSVSPVPLYPSKRDLVLLALGIYPGYFHNQTMRPSSTKRGGLAIYLDVSGSVTEALPRILGILLPLKNCIKSIFQFSNQTVEVSFADLMEGKIMTTGGTDFNCVAESILEKDLDKAVIITDGSASLNGEMASKLEEQKPAILTIIVDGKESCPDFEPFGEVVPLEEVIG
ncbi:MAG: hypothetical protein SWE60_18450 [Thermodesulfobacteriota bacterium]|nr:hypothetical protein [Thermodesulfobacteriota bacterium]